MLAGQVDSTITFLRAPDLDAASDFYTRLLGFRLALDQGSCRIFAIRPGAYLGFCQGEAAEAGQGVILTFVVADVDAACARLEAAGVAIEARPRYNPAYNIYQFFARDPNGYLIEVQRFLDPAWAAQAEK